MVLKNPLSQEGFVILQREVPVTGLSENGRCPAECGAGINQISGIKGGPALFALVAIGIFVAAVGTGSGNIAVGKELLCRFVVVLFGTLFFEKPFVVKGSKDFRSGFVMYLRRGP